MKTAAQHTIYTIGHSMHSFDTFIAMLQSFQVKALADIRRFPGSKKYSQFNKPLLSEALQETGIHYVHFENLGGRRKMDKDSKNIRWRKEAFRGYADYMETASFTKAMDQLEMLALQQTTAYMCSEAVWWRCHRSMVSDYLKAKGWEVLHIMSAGKVTPHPYTAAARVAGDQVYYYDDNLFDQ